MGPEAATLEVCPHHLHLGGESLAACHPHQLKASRGVHLVGHMIAGHQENTPGVRVHHRHHLLPSRVRSAGH